MVNSGEIIVKGEAKEADTVTSGGETEWGYWIPRDSDVDRGNSKKPSSSTGNNDFSYHATPTSAGFPASPSSSGSSPFPGFNSTTTGLDTNPTQLANTSDSTLGRASKACWAPVDAKYGLLTACLGDYFDQDLDDSMGYEEMTAADKEFLQSLYTAQNEEAEPIGPSLHSAREAATWKKHRRSLSRRRRWWLWRKIGKAWRAVTKLKRISGSINKEMQWQLLSHNHFNKIQDKNARQVVSPWGNSILLKSFGPRKRDKQHIDKYLNIFCVGCGVKGQARISGRAAWSVIDGFSEARMDLHTDMEFSLKIGIDAKISYTHDFHIDLLDVGLPGVSYGPVIVGLYLSLSARVGLMAAATGKLLAGAEMGLHDAHIAFDLISRTPPQSGWEPYFNPIFESNGNIMVSAELGLPIALKLGLKVFKFEKSVKLVNEPSVRGTAQVAASVGKDESGKFSAGFKSTDGCTGILSQLPWRNRLYADAFDAKSWNLFDTKNRELARYCIPLPSRIIQHQQNSTKVKRLAARAVDEPMTNISEITDTMLESFAGGFSDELSYDPDNIEDMSYNNTQGIKFERLVDMDETTMVVTCSNGNMYAVVAERNETNLDCSVLWEITADNTLVLDGASRAMHYATDAMKKAGVSRVRLGPVDKLAKGSRLIVWTIERDPDAPEGYGSYYLVRNADGDIFYPIVCEYNNDAGPKVFLAKDPNEGIKTLESDDVVFSITGGSVQGCYGLALLQEDFNPEEDALFYSLSGTEEDYFDYDD